MIEPMTAERLLLMHNERDWFRSSPTKNISRKHLAEAVDEIDRLRAEVERLTGLITNCGSFTCPHYDAFEPAQQ